jgi:hypothetical protein
LSIKGTIDHISLPQCRYPDIRRWSPKTGQCAKL